MNPENEKISSIDIVKNHIFKQLESHILKVGDRLPTEVQLAEQLSVSRSSVREALLSLKVIGLVGSAQGSGYTIIGDTKKSFSEALRALMTIYSVTLTDISEIREALEVKAAQLAIQHTIDAESITYLKDLISEMEKFSRTDSALVTESDTKFHRKIAELSRNPFLINFVLALSDFSNKYILISWADVTSDEISELLITHKKIVDYLETQNISAVTSEIANHYHIADCIIKNHQKKNNSKEAVERLLEQLYETGYSTEEIFQKLSK